MKELDLDELHQAVSALMDDPAKPKSKKTARKTAKKIDDKPVHSNEDPAQPGPEAQPEMSAGRADDGRVEVKRPTQKLAVPQRRRGIAMDIVQTPKVGNAPEAPSSRASREAPTIAPSKPVAPEPASSVPKPADVPSVQPDEPTAEVNEDILASINLKDSDTPTAQSAQSVAATKKPADDNQWPDPLEFHGFKDDIKEDEPKAPPAEPAKVPQDPAPTLDVPEQAQITPAPSNEPDDAIGTSPFVTTKVEKRPLGAFTNEQPASQPPANKPAVPSNAPEAEPDALLEQDQKEFSPELMAVEGSQPPTAVQPDAGTSSGAIPTPASSAGLDTNRQMPIPQQYRVAAKEPASDTRPVFDTEDYHPPLIPDHVPHRSSAKKWVLVLMLLILAGAGAVAYLVFTGVLTLPL